MTVHRHKKALGQHFLRDPSYLERIVDAIRPEPGDNMVEIGPGLGALTGPLLDRLDRLQAVEFDRDLIPRLRATFPADRLIVHEADALKFDFGSLGPDLRVVGNLPYNISSPLLFRLAEYADRIRDLHFMLQKEVVDRMVAAPATPDYGRLSVMIQARFRVAGLFVVPPSAFDPPPKVDSAVVRMQPLPAEAIAYHDGHRFGEIVARAFGQRRKTLRNTLKGLLANGELERLGIDPQRRGETLSVDEFARLANEGRRVDDQNSR